MRSLKGGLPLKDYYGVPKGGAWDYPIGAKFVNKTTNVAYEICRSLIIRKIIGIPKNSIAKKQFEFAKMLRNFETASNFAFNICLISSKFVEK